jgi:hypothetical protein
VGGGLVGGFSVDNLFEENAGRVYACVYCQGGSRQFSKDVFGDTLRAAIGPQRTALWSVDTNRSCPVNRYAERTSARAAFLDSDRFNELVVEQFNQLGEFVEPVAESIRKALQSRSTTK